MGARERKKMIYKHTQKHAPSLIFLGLSSLLLIAVTSIGFWYYRQEFRNHDYLITDHLDLLERIFNDINNNAHILSFDHERNYINFLNVKSFAGSEIGSMNLVYPQKWNGPYLVDNPTIQGKEYVILSTQNGYYIIPDNGVRLGNGSIIGREIILNASTDINHFLEDPRLFLSSKKPLVRKIKDRKTLVPIEHGPPLSDSLAE
jgi:hypothetical protein